ncbi:MAG: undecaprenyl-phosphate galactose phosphotransferase WbaP [Anaerolineales bacterium]|nr:undecaprenyl-phosphate galactose phosphotransferase WbaP [Anaerolineales bacterium]MCW5855105.1 undecaprenyl-phosphate galactose phosphotransferase WbaP [Anaerolineales bacterium]
MWLLMFAADLLGFLLTLGAVLLINQIVPLFRPDLYDLKYLVVLLICWGFLVTSRLYPGVGVNPADEIRLVTQSISLGVLIGLAIFTAFDLGWVANAWTFLLAWLEAIFAVIVCRWVIKILASRAGWWGEPVIVVGRDANTDQVVQFLLNRRRLGFVPVSAVLKQVRMNVVPSSSLNSLESMSDDYYRKAGIHTVIVNNLMELGLKPTAVERLFKLFENVVLIASTELFEGASMKVHDLEGLLGIETKKAKPSFQALLLKRAMDIVLAILLGLIVAPACLVITIFIRLEGPGPIFFYQDRVGVSGRVFRMFKFRTMGINAEQRLAAYLEGNPDARAEWERDQKLRQDPRLTRVGKFLRKWSLDELPQLVNVFLGEMSFVGPRPMLVSQVSLYGKGINAYYSMRPGLTGMWQVSGRNKTTFAERASFDSYYTRNWSTWLDLYILLRTVWVVFRKDGAL